MIKWFALFSFQIWGHICSLMFISALLLYFIAYVHVLDFFYDCHFDNILFLVYIGCIAKMANLLL